MNDPKRHITYDSDDYRRGLAGMSGSGVSWEIGRSRREEESRSFNWQENSNQGSPLVGCLVLGFVLIASVFANVAVFGALTLWIVFRWGFRLQLPERPMLFTWTALGVLLLYLVPSVGMVNHALHPHLDYAIQASSGVSRLENVETSLHEAGVLWT